MYKRSNLFKYSSFLWNRNDIVIKTLSNLKLHIYNSVYILYVRAYWSYIICCQYMYVNTLYRCMSLYFRTIIRFYKVKILSVAAPVGIVMVLLIHVWIVLMDLEALFCIYKYGSLWPWIISNVGIVNWFLWSFLKLHLLFSHLHMYF